MESQTCPQCNGHGKCQLCKGKGVSYEVPIKDEDKAVKMDFRRYAATDHDKTGKESLEIEGDPIIQKNCKACKGTGRCPQCDGNGFIQV